MATGEWYKDYAAVQRRTPAGAGGASWAAYLKAKNATSEGYERAFKELDIAARQEGATVNRPAMTAGMSQAQYQDALQKYLVNINDEVLKKNVTAALKDVQKQGMQVGAHVQLPSLANLTSANAQSVVNSYIDIVNQTINKNYVNMSLSDLRAQGVANGVNVPIPAVSNTVSQAQAQEIVNKYQSRINSALLVKSTQDALKSVQSQAKSYGVNVAVPTISAGITEQAANALLDKYVADVNAKLSSVTVSESKPASNNQIQTSSEINNTLVGSTVTAPSVSIARNSDGSLAVNEGLYNQLKAAQTQYKSWWNDYSGIPQQVIDSQATDVRINSKGQFEWTPVTAADKAQLEKINVQRTRSGLAPRTTLIHGPEKSNEYNTKWLSTTGSGSRGVGESGVKIKDASGKTVKSYDYNTANLAKVGSGDIKIAAMKAGSSVNANATAKTNTAQDVKAVKIAKKDIVADVASVSVSSKQPIDYTKPFFDTTALASTAKLITKDLQKFQTVSQTEQNLVDAKVAKALEEAHKINPKGSKEYFEGVANVARRNTMSTKEIMKEDLARANKQIGEKVTIPIINNVMKVLDARDRVLAETSITITDKGKFAIDKKGKESVKGITYNAGDVHKDVIKNSAILSGYNQFMDDEIKTLKTKPVNFAAEAGLIYAGGAAFGAGLGGVKAVVNPKLAKAAGKIVSKTGSKTISKIANAGSKYAVDATAIGLPVTYTAGRDIAYFNSADYKALTDIEKDVVKTQYAANLFKTGKELIIAAPGFNAGARSAEGAIAKYKASKLLTPRIKKVSDLENALPSEFDITNVAKFAPKQAPKTTVEKIAILKKRVDVLEARGKVSDKPKIKALKRQINAAENKQANKNVVSLLKDKNSVQIKDVASDQAFDKELSNLRNLKRFADDYAGPLKVTRPSEAALETALERLAPYDRAVIRQLKADKGNLAVSRNTKSQYVKESPEAVKALVSQVGKSAIRKANTTTKNMRSKLRTNKDVKKSLSEYDKLEYEKELSAALSTRNKKVESKSWKDEDFDAELGDLRNKAFDTKVSELKADKAFDMELAQLRRMKTFADNYMAEGKYKVTDSDPIMGVSQAEKALMRLKPGEKIEIKAINAGTTAKRMIGDRAKTNKKLHDIANKRLQEAAKKKSDAEKINALVKKYKQKIKTGPAKVKAKTAKAKQAALEKLQKSKNLEHKEAKQLLKNAKEYNKFKNTPEDVTNVVGYRRSQKARKTLTFRDIADYKVKNPSSKPLVPKQRKVKIDEYNFLKNAEELARVNNRLKTQNKGKSISDKEFDAELKNLKIKDFDQRLKELRTKQESNALMTESEAEAAVARVTESIKNVMSEKLKVESNTKVEDKFTAARKRTVERNNEIQKSYGNGGSEVASGNLKLMQKAKIATKSEVLSKSGTEKLKVLESKKRLKRRTSTKSESGTKSIVKSKNIKRKELPKSVKKQVPIVQGLSRIPKGSGYAVTANSGNMEYQHLRYPGDKVSQNMGVRALEIIDAVDSVVNRLRVPTDVPVKQGIRQSSINAIKPTVTTLSNTRQVLTSDAQTAQIIKPLLKPILDEAVKLKALQKLSIGYSTPSTVRTPQALMPAYPKKPLKTTGKAPKRQPNKEKLSRYIKNQLGSLKTLF